MRNVAGWRYLLQVLSAAVAGVLKNIRIIKIAANQLLATYQTIHYLSPNVQNWLPTWMTLYFGAYSILEDKKLVAQKEFTLS